VSTAFTDVSCKALSFRHPSGPNKTHESTSNIVLLFFIFITLSVVFFVPKPVQANDIVSLALNPVVKLEYPNPPLSVNPYRILDVMTEQ
jgi:hypothetical protein